MIQHTGLTDTYELSYYQRNSRETISLRKGDNDNLIKINADGTESALDRYEGPAISTAPIPCENYNDLKNKAADAPLLSWNKLFHESYDVMEGFYAGEKTIEDVTAYIKKTCSFSTATKTGITKALSTVYEHMSRANAQNAAEKNAREAEKLYTETGLRSDVGDYYGNLKGTMYYNADYYYAYKEMQTVFKDTLNELADSYGASRPDYDAVDNSKTFIDGGITYNGVWNQKTINTYRGLDDYGVIDNSFVPSGSFLFCEARVELREKNDLDTVKAAITKYVNENMRKNTGNNRSSLVMELQKNSLYNNDLREGKGRIHQYLEANNIPIKNTADRNWIMDYFGMVML